MTLGQVRVFWCLFTVWLVECGDSARATTSRELALNETQNITRNVWPPVGGASDPGRML